MISCIRSVLVLPASYIIPYIFFFNDTATTEIYTLSLHDALPISHPAIHAERKGQVRMLGEGLLQQVCERAVLLGMHLMRHIGGIVLEPGRSVHAGYLGLLGRQGDSEVAGAGRPATAAADSGQAGALRSTRGCPRACATLASFFIWDLLP